MAGPLIIRTDGDWVTRCILTDSTIFGCHIGHLQWATVSPDYRTACGGAGSDPKWIHTWRGMLHGIHAKGKYRQFASNRLQINNAIGCLDRRSRCRKKTERVQGVSVRDLPRNLVGDFKGLGGRCKIRRRYYMWRSSRAHFFSRCLHLVHGLRGTASIFILKVQGINRSDRTYMALTRGTAANFPCTRDLTPAGELSVIQNDYTRRTAQQTAEVISQALKWQLTRGMKGQAENLLKSHSLRPVRVSAYFMLLLLFSPTLE